MLDVTPSQIPSQADHSIDQEDVAYDPHHRGDHTHQRLKVEIDAYVTRQIRQNSEQQARRKEYRQVADQPAFSGCSWP